jgi:hypothetical protein
MSVVHELRIYHKTACDICGCRHCRQPANIDLNRRSAIAVHFKGHPATCKENRTGADY